MAKSIFTSLSKEEDDHLVLINTFYNKLEESGEWEDIGKVIKNRE